MQFKYIKYNYFLERLFSNKWNKYFDQKEVFTDRLINLIKKLLIKEKYIQYFFQMKQIILKIVELTYQIYYKVIDI